MKDEYSVIGIEKNFERVISEGVTFKDALKIVEETNNYFDKVSISLDYNMRNPSRNILVFSDCEMMIVEVKKLLADRPENLDEQLIFLGNFISKQDGFIEFMDYLLMLKKEGRKLVFVKGVNEYNLLEEIHGTRNFIGDDVNRKELISSIEKQLGYTLLQLKIMNPNYYNLLNDAYDYFEDDKHIFTSGGLNFNSYWRETSPVDFHITTDSFLSSINNTGKTIVFGYECVEKLNNSVFKKPWIDKDKKKIGINGNVKNYGRLIGLSIIEGERYFIGIRHRKTRQKTYAYDIYDI